MTSCVAIISSHGLVKGASSWEIGLCGILRLGDVDRSWIRGAARANRAAHENNFRHDEQSFHEARFISGSGQ